MKIRLKFAVLFAGIVSGLLIVSMVVTYLFFAAHRRDDYKERLYQQAIYQYNSFVDSSEITQESFTKVLLNTPSALNEIQALYVNSEMKVIFSYPNNGVLFPDTALLQQARLHGSTFFNTGEREGIVLNGVDKNRKPIFLAISAFDKYGKRKQHNLLITLAVVCAAGILVTAFFALFFIKQIDKPIRKLNREIQFITGSNLHDRISIPRGFAELEKLTTSFNKMLDRLNHAFILQRNFVHHASHELRTPLAIMLSQTEAALGRDLSVPEMKAVLQSLKEDQQAMIALTNSLLLLSQFETTRFSSQWPLVRLDEIVYDSIAAIKKLYPDVKVNVTYNQLPEYEHFLSVHGNEVLLRSAISNLLKNAYTYSSDQKIQVDLGEDNGNCEVAITNSGESVPEADRDKLFVPFFRSHNSEKKKGYGLGLSIVDRIARLHKGKVVYESPDENSNRFILLFPKL